MTAEERAAYINSQVACALIEMEGMKAENTRRLSFDCAIAYPETAFSALIDKYGISHNAVLYYLQQ